MSPDTGNSAQALAPRLGECDLGERPRPCPMEMGDELLDLLKEARAPKAAGAGEHERDLRGVPEVLTNYIETNIKQMRGEHYLECRGALHHCHWLGRRQSP